MNKMNASLRLGLSSSSVTVVHTSGWMRPHMTIFADEPMDASSPFEMLASLDRALTVSDCRRLPISVVLADQWARLFMVTPPTNATRLGDCKAVAARRFQLLYGDDAAQWLIDGDWSAEKPFLACAIPRSLHAVLQKICNKHRLTLVRIAPQFIFGWNKWRRPLEGAWFGTLHGNAMTLGAISRGRLVAIRRLILTTAQRKDPYPVVAQIKREALRLALPQPTAIQVCGALPQEWRDMRYDGASFIPVDPVICDRSTIRQSLAADLACTGVAI